MTTMSVPTRSRMRLTTRVLTQRETTARDTAPREPAPQPPRFVSIAHVLAIMARARCGPLRQRIIVSYAPSHLPPLLTRRSRAGLSDGCDESSALLIGLVRRLLSPDTNPPPTARRMVVTP